MHDTRNKNETQSYLAERGVIVEQEEGAFLVMSDGHILRRADVQEPAQIVAFDNYAISLAEFVAEDGTGGEYRPRERYFTELWSPEDGSRLYKNQPGTFRAELHERLAAPLYPLVFALIIVAIIGQPKSTRSSRMESLVIAFIAAAGCRIAGLALNNFSAANAAFVPVVYALPLGAAVLALLAIRRGRRSRADGALFDRFAATIDMFKRLVPKRWKSTEPAGAT
jgi:lipopolysaccharide export system permease protein